MPRTTELQAAIGGFRTGMFRVGDAERVHQLLNSDGGMVAQRDAQNIGHRIKSATL